MSLEQESFQNQSPALAPQQKIHINQLLQRDYSNASKLIPTSCQQLHFFLHMLKFQQNMIGSSVLKDGLSQDDHEQWIIVEGQS